MNKVEYLGLQIENELKKKEDEILKKFEEYLKNNSEKVNIKMNNVSFDDIVNYSGNNTEFFQIVLYIIFLMIALVYYWIVMVKLLFRIILEKNYKKSLLKM